jgi:hypothetical protein
MIVNIITTLNKNQLFTQNFPVEGTYARVGMLKDWAKYFIADGEEYNIKNVVVYGNDPAGTVVPFETRKETCETVSSLSDSDTHKVVINCLDGNVLVANVRMFVTHTTPYPKKHWVPWRECTPEDWKG